MTAPSKPDVRRRPGPANRNGAPPERAETGVAIEAAGDPWANYNPERARAAIRQAAGGFDGLDCEALKRDIREQREQWRDEDGE